MTKTTWASAAALGVVTASTLLAAGCRAHRTDDGTTSSGPSAACAAAGTQPGPSPIRRLTHVEYDNTLRDLLGDDTRPSSAFPPDERLSIFSNDANAQTVTRLLAEGYMTAAEGAGERALSSSSFDTLLPCPIETADDACIGAFIDDFGARAFRRPLDDDDRADLRAAFDAGRAEGDARSGFASVIEVALQSPEYLYRVELGASSASPPSSPSPWSRSQPSSSPRACRISSGERCPTRRCSPRRRADSCRPPTAFAPRRRACSPIRKPG